MSKYTRQEASDLCNKLLSNIAVAKERARAGERYSRELEVNKASLAAVNEELKGLTLCAKHMDDIYHNITHYANEHQRTAKEILDRAIEEAGALVPDAGVANAHLKYTGNSVIVVNENDQSLDLREGGGYRTSLGILLRYALIKAQPGALPFMLLDEQTFTLSDATTAAIKEVLAAMKRDITIVMIEQRRNAADGIADKEYMFSKSADGEVVVTEVF